jgi:hypothetical protein
MKQTGHHHRCRLVAMQRMAADSGPRCYMWIPTMSPGDSQMISPG